MKELVEVLAKALVDHPDEVVVTETEKDNATVVELRVSIHSFKSPPQPCRISPSFPSMCRRSSVVIVVILK